MPATMTFTLSSKLTSELAALTNSYVYALPYNGGQIVSGSIATLVQNGQPTNQSVTLGDSFSGRVYLLVQKSGDGNLATLITGTNGGNQNAITPATSASNSSGAFTYTYVEPTVSGLVDISNIDVFAFPLSLSNASGQTRGFAPGVEGASLRIALQLIGPGSLQTNGLVVGPGQGQTLASNPWPATDWTDYVKGLKDTPAVFRDITLLYAFAGSAQDPTPKLAQYEVRYQQYDQKDYFVLKPVTVNGTNAQDWVRITPDNLMKSIYRQDGPIDISTDGGTTWTQSSTTTPTTAAGGIVRRFIEGFEANYWGGSSSSPNPYDKSPIDLNKSWSWNYNYAYGGALSDQKLAINNVLGKGIGSPGSRYEDPWAHMLASNASSNVYGWPYTDSLSRGGTNPQIDTTSSLAVKLFSNTETLTAASGYVGPPPSYVPPTGPERAGGLPGYKSADTTSQANNISFQFGFNTGQTSWSPQANTPLLFRFYAPSDSTAKADGFVELNLTQYGGGNDWQTFFVRGGSGSWSAQPIGAPPAGQFNLNFLPVTSDGSTAWYQIVFGDQNDRTIYNIYAKSNGQGAFLPIFGTGSDPSNFVVDHGLGYGTGQGVNQATGQPSGQTNYTVDFAPSGVMTYNINTFSPPDTIFGTSDDDTLNGTAGDDTINGAPGNDIINGGAGTDTAYSWESSRNFSLTLAKGGSTITIKDKVGTDGTDRLTSIERVHFGDKTIDASSILKTAALPVTEIMKVVGLYTAGLNRAPDALGLDYYAARLADGASIGDIAKAIFGSSEAAPIYSTANSNPAFVNLAYQTAFGHAPDTAGAAFWVNELNTGHIQRTDLVTALVAAVRAPGGNAADAQYVTNREAVGAHFALTQGLNSVTSARAVVAAVDGTPASVTAANAQTDAFVVTASTAAGSELVVQIVGLVP